MRKRWIWDKSRMELVPVEEYQAPASAGVFVMGDIKPYKSMATGEMIEGRAAHREHLKRNNLVEIGDAWDKRLPDRKPIESPAGLKETIARIAYEKLKY